MPIHFISDLHLSAEQPALTKLFTHYLQHQATEADVLFILGDLFEQPLIMWAFIGWGWLSIWVMVFSIYDTIGQL